MLACKVDHLTGRVQWVRAGLALGYSYPNITGFTRCCFLSLLLLPAPLTRYTMVGDHTAGEYNIQVTQVQLADEGYWECQVIVLDLSMMDLPRCLDPPYCEQGLSCGLTCGPAHWCWSDRWRPGPGST